MAAGLVALHDHVAEQEGESETRISLEERLHALPYDPLSLAATCNMRR